MRGEQAVQGAHRRALQQARRAVEAEEAAAEEELGASRLQRRATRGRPAELLEEWGFDATSVSAEELVWLASLQQSPGGVAAAAV